MYDTRVYKERRRARFENDPEYRQREQQRHRERYQNKKAESNARTDSQLEEHLIEEVPVGRAMKREEIGDVHEEINVDGREDIIHDISSSSSSTSYPQPVCHGRPSQEHQSGDTQIVSIKLPKNMAVVVVPVNLTTVSEDETIQLQQIGKSVAIVRGSMTNVAEFQLLPTFHYKRPGIVAMDAEIRQIMLEADEWTGPTIEVIPQMIPAPLEEPSYVVTEVVPPKQHPPPPAVPAAAAPKAAVAKKSSILNTSHIEGIRCGRCLELYEDLDVLSDHQKNDHQMMSISRPGEDHIEEEPLFIESTPLSGERSYQMEAVYEEEDPSLIQRVVVKSDTGIGQMRVKKANLVKPQNIPLLAPIKRAPVTRARGGRGGRGRGTGRCTSITSTTITKAAGVVTATATAPKSLLKCDICSLTYDNVDTFNTHILEHDDDEPEIHVNAEMVNRGMKQNTLRINPNYKSTNSKLAKTEHIIKDPSGNQIIVHAESQEQLQELLAGLAEGSIQMISKSGGSNEMVCVDNYQGQEVDQQPEGDYDESGDIIEEDHDMYVMEEVVADNRMDVEVRRGRM